MNPRFLVLIGLVTATWLWLRSRRRGHPVFAPALPVVICPLHGIAFDAEKEVCPECGQDPNWRSLKAPIAISAACPE